MSNLKTEGILVYDIENKQILKRLVTEKDLLNVCSKSSKFILNNENSRDTFFVHEL